MTLTEKSSSHNYPVAKVAKRLGISTTTLYYWIKTFSQSNTYECA
ncbi:helix-turn-helix domain-containing protein [Hydrogenovibrio sp. SC-1]